MAKQPSEPPARTTRSTYRKGVFVTAFIFLWLESLILVTSTAWEGYAPCWANPILDKSGPLLGVAAAVALLLSLLWAWNPTGLARYATLSSGVLSFAAATHSLELGPNDLPLGLALLGLALPLCVIMLPNLRWPESKADLWLLLPPVPFIAITTMSIILGIEPVTKIAVEAGIRGLGGLVTVALATGVVSICGIIIIRRAIQLVVRFVKRRSWPHRLWRRISRPLRKTRAAQRRQKRQRQVGNRSDGCRRR